MLLILAGVALATLTGNTSIINNANKAVEKYNASANDDQKVLNQVKDLFAKYMGEKQVGKTGHDNIGDDDDDTPAVQTYTITYNANGGAGEMEQATASTTAANGFTSPLNNGFIGWNTAADGSGASYAPGASINEDLTLYAIWGGTYRLGQEVTINVTKGAETIAESFYVIEDEGANANDVTLITKYNLDKNKDPNDSTGKYYQKPNATYEATACAFSNTNYWKNNISYDSDYTDLNDEDKYGVAGSGTVIDRAKTYATSTVNPNATGRLLTYEEADELKDCYGNMIYGKANQVSGSTSGGGLSYWLSSARGSNFVMYVGGNWGTPGFAEGLVDDDRMTTDDFSGVRPVVTVPKTVLNH